MNPFFIPLLEAICDPHVFKHGDDDWYKYPKDKTKSDFIMWYQKETMSVEVSHNSTHFRVVSYPSKAEFERLMRVVCGEQHGYVTTFIIEEEYFDGL